MLLISWGKIDITIDSQAEENPGKVFVQKSNDHRGIKILTIDKIDLRSSDSFVQEYIDKPFLVDGYKFDIGVYTIITSFDPLRVYIYNGDILFRYFNLLHLKYILTCIVLMTISI